MSGFVHLHTHSHYSFLKALPKVEELVEAAKAAGMDAVALTDEGNLHGAIEFYKSGVKEGVKPIIGVDAYIARDHRIHDRDEKLARLVLIAENMDGYRNLLSLVTTSYSDGLADKPTMDLALIKQHHEGVIALIPSFAGAVAQSVAAGDEKGAAATLAEYVSIFGAGNTFLEITHHPKVPGHEDKMRKMEALGKKAGVPCVAQHDVYYLAPDDREATETMRRISHGEPGRNEEEDFSFVTGAQMLAWFQHMPEAVAESGRIADRCQIEFSLGKWIFPTVDHDVGKDHNDMLRERAYQGITTRGLTRTKDVEDRIEYELSIIKDKGFATYFLVVSDLLTFAKSEGILTTTRGSAGGSLVSYLSGITNVDPLFYKLPFERFLNPERPKAPDIDMDFADNRRGEVIAYAKRKYGADHVAQIGTFGTMLARAAVRDVARALGHSYGTGDRIAKLIPLGSQGFPMTIDRALEETPELADAYQEDDDTREIIDLAKRIEGCVRHVGVHAAGVVIAPTPLIEWTPLQLDPKGSGAMITQYDMYSISDEYGGVGLLKFDFLGIKNLAVLADAVAEVETTQGMMIDIETIPIDDAKTFAMLARGETEGLFQLNGSGMTRYLKELKPTTIHDINAMVALYRPGPIETIPQYIERKRNPRLVRYLDERMQEYLDASYGLIVYQDDVLLTAVKLAGYSWLQADALRKAMGKKIPAEMEAQKENLVKGFKEFGGLNDAKSEAIWKLIEPFAAYGFNKAHAASYGKVAYQTGYMKANYPVEYMKALMTADAGNIEEISKFVAECGRMKIPVLPPDVNESFADFAVAGENKDTIRFGLTTIKNFGEGIAQALIEERAARGAFASLADFLSRVGSKNLNRKSLESLIKCGALEHFPNENYERSHLLAHLDMLVEYHREATAEAPQDSLFGMMTTPELRIPPGGSETPLLDKLLWEKELLGIYVSGHPLDAYGDITAKSKLTIGAIREDPRPGMPIILPVLVSDVRSIITKKGDKMVFVKFEDRTDTIEAVIFPKLYAQHSALIQEGTCLLVKGSVSNRNNELGLTIENLKAL